MEDSSNDYVSLPFMNFYLKIKKQAQLPTAEETAEE